MCYACKLDNTAGVNKKEKVKSVQCKHCTKNKVYHEGFLHFLYSEKQENLSCKLMFHLNSTCEYLPENSIIIFTSFYLFLHESEKLSKIEARTDLLSIAIPFWSSATDYYYGSTIWFIVKS